jgi:hypothetical protein
MEDSSDGAITVGVAESELTTITVVVAVLPNNLAVMVTEPGRIWDRVVAVKLTDDCPALTVTELGTVMYEDVSETFMLASAVRAEPNVARQTVDWRGTIVAGEQENDWNVPAGTTVRARVAEEDPVAAVSVAVWADVTVFA